MVVPRVLVAACTAGVLLAVAGCAGAAAAGPVSVSTTDAGPAATATAPTVTATASLCAQFPARTDQPGDVEGWWSSTPAKADGTILTDPALWPEPLMREHPRVALVNTGTGTVISTWDRLTCGPDDTYEPTVGADWPADAVVVVDIDTEKVISVVG